MTEILIVEDERIFARALTALFEAEGYAVRLARTGSEAMAKFDARRPDVVLLDVMLPEGDGFGVCRRMREQDAFVPIVFNTALDRTEDKRRGLELGGDDYVLKTDPPEELIARVARAVRRHRAFQEVRERNAEFAVGRTTVVLSRLEVREPDGSFHRLTRTEADILRLLNTARGENFTVEAIVEATRGEGFVCDEGSVYVHLAHLRRKLGSARELLVTDRGRGYRLLK